MAYGFNDDKSKASLSNGSWTFLEQSNKINYSERVQINVSNYYNQYQEIVVMINQKMPSVTQSNFNICAQTRYDVDQVKQSSSEVNKINEITLRNGGSSFFRLFLGTQGYLTIENDSDNTYEYYAVLYGVNPKT